MKNEASRYVIIGVDDTDNLNSVGTGHLVRKLGFFLHQNNVFFTKIIVRHQLFVHKDIPFTSHNSSASLSGYLLNDMEELIINCEKFLIENAALGSDVGLCITYSDTDNKQELIKWGMDAKTIILNEDNCYALANKSNAYLKGLTGKKTGIIGAMAAVGLALSGDDGRVLWMKNLRETKGIFKIKDIREIIGIDVFTTESEIPVNDNALIELGEWNRPIVKKHQTVLYVKQNNLKPNEYKTSDKHFIKSLSE